jgi:hypothetical protein
MCTRVWFNCGVVCTHEKKKYANPISDKLKLRFCKKSTKRIVMVHKIVKDVVGMLVKVDN